MHIQYTYNHGGAIMKDNNFVNLGKRIREKRLSRNLTQEALAEKADVGTTHISHIETGCTKLSLTTFISIANHGLNTGCCLGMEQNFTHTILLIQIRQNGI